MLEGFATAMGLGRRNTDKTDNNVLPAPGENINQQQMLGDRGDGDDNTEWMLVTDGATRGAASRKPDPGGETTTYGPTSNSTNQADCSPTPHPTGELLGDSDGPQKAGT